MKEILFKFLKFENDKKRLRVGDNFLGYPLYKENDYYQIFKRPVRRKKIVAGCGKMVIIQSSSALIIYPNIANKLYKFRIKINNRFFPGIIPNSEVDRVMIIPFIRKVGNDVLTNSFRIVVITSKGQVFHNFPSISEENDGKQKESDICVFEESCIWDLPSSKYPSENPNCECFERYYPGLPSDCYRYYPPISEKNKKCFIYFENGKEVVLPRFYFYSRTSNSNSLHFMGGGEMNHKMTIIGTYRTNTHTGVRTCLFATDDGGKNWFCKYEYSDVGEYSFRQGNSTTWGLNYGNHIRNRGYDKDYEPNSFELFRRNVILNDADSLFSWEQIGKVLSFVNHEYIVIDFSEEHHLSNGNIVVLRGRQQGSNRDWMLNNSFTSQSNGNGMLFKVIVIDEKRIELAECVCQSAHNIACRHVHHINKIKDGWIVGTGEIYPNGWLHYIQMKEADTFSVKKAYSSFDIFRLNSTQNSVQRTMGAVISDDNDPVLLYASDHDTLDMGQVTGIKKLLNKNVSRNSTGVFVGKLSDINDRTQFKCVFGASEPCFYFQKINGKYIFCGQRGELAISFDGGERWIEDRIDDCFCHYHGNSYGYHFFDDYVIRFKK